MIPCKNPSLSGVRSHRASASASRCPGCSSSFVGSDASTPAAISSTPPSSVSASGWLSGADRMLNELDRGMDAYGTLGGDFGVTIKPSGECEVYTQDGTHRVGHAPEGAMVHLKPLNPSVTRTPSVRASYRVKKNLSPHHWRPESEMADQSHKQVDVATHESLNVLMDGLSEAKGNPEAQVAAVEAAKEHLKSAKDQEGLASITYRGGMGRETEVFVNTHDPQEGADHLYRKMMNDISGLAVKSPDFRSPFKRGRFVSDETNIYSRDSGRRPIKLFTAIDDGDQHFTMALKKRDGPGSHTSTFTSSGTKEQAVKSISYMLDIVRKDCIEGDARLNSQKG